MKTLKLFGLMIAGACVLQACSNANKSSESVDSTITSTTTITDSTAMSGMENSDTSFMSKAAVGGMMEVEAGKLALKSNNAKVKAFAEKMVKDHSMANEELKTIAAKKSFMLPATFPAAENSHMEEMKKMSGANFDKHYIDMMVTDHDKTIALFKNAANSADADVKAFASKTIPVITGHFEEAKALQATMK